jgi:hypothetical protein
MSQNTIVKLDVFNVVKTAWSKVSGTKEAFFYIFLSGFVIQVLSKFINYHLSHEQDVLLLIGLGVIGLIITVVYYLVYCGALYLGVKRANDESIQFSMIKRVFNLRTALKLIIVCLIIVVPSVCLFFLLLLAESSSVAGILFPVVGIIWIYFFIRIHFASAAVIIEPISAWAAIKLSFRSTKGNALRLIGLLFINAFIVLVSIIPLGIGLIWSMPYAYISYGVAYKRLMPASASL